MFKMIGILFIGMALIFIINFFLRTGSRRWNSHSSHSSDGYDNNTLWINNDSSVYSDSDVKRDYGGGGGNSDFGGGGGSDFGGGGGGSGGSSD